MSNMLIRIVFGGGGNFKVLKRKLRTNDRSKSGSDIRWYGEGDRIKIEFPEVDDRINGQSN